jgi:hypothetical protein
MDRAMVRIVLACALTIAVASVASAQSSQANDRAQQAKTKKHANQVPDSGFDQPDADPGADQFERVIENVPVRVRADGTVVAELDDSFMEAMTLTVAADGTLTFGHHAGLATANRAMRLLPARVLPPLFPILEEKE